MKSPRRPTLRTPALLLTGALTLSGCGALSDGGADASDGLQVVTAFYPLQYVAGRVAGDLADVTNLTQPGGEPHDLDIDPRATGQIVDADVVVHESGFQPAVDSSVDANATGEVVDAAEVVDLRTLEDEDADGDAEEHTADDGHDHDDLDPHFWQDPLRMADLGDAVAESLAAVDPDNAADYTANAADLRTDLEALDARYAETLSGCERQTVVVSHDAFGYLTKYGLDMEPIAGLSPEAEPTPADLARLQDLIATEGVTTVFAERLGTRKIADSLASDVGVTTAVLDPIEGLSDETADQDYLSLMEANLGELAEANGCQ
ncbi:zinc ABC transporter substrate-binding protein [Nocardioides psychrotolerans]|uniref:Zinc transport system substrate-binding protein n=1 Tax=Nocardioides psychrotolerans TaxID=1005945 RepID=A0A1I3FAM4_9ACTN|nr:metal ABC transporter substrate-binding protein [Nocardioides psychrotolerans]GEP37784.1 zinc ABC transporter substrate-binding protein [Nocardioides psychrotolerans]SFI08180.1 zinc transport system substrate-binding protein [Nocardioides psychrotolerans]